MTTPAPNRHARTSAEAHERKGARSRVDITLPIERQPAYLTFADVGALLGKCVRTISSYEQRGLLRVLRPAGGNPLIERSEVERLLTEGTAGPR